MGICASCLGLNRHPLQDIDETDALLEDSRQPQYGTHGLEDDAQPDEEEIRRERQELEQITAEAAENMIDVSHMSTADLSHHFAHTNHDRHRDDRMSDRPNSKLDEDVEAEEAAWLQSIQSAGLDSVNEVRGFQAGALVMDITQLRQEQPPPSAKKVSRSAVR